MLGYDAVLVTSLLTWVQVTVACGVLLFIEALLVLVVALIKHLRWPILLRALVPFVASLGAGIAALQIHNTYLYVLQLEGYFGGSGPRLYYNLLERQIANEIHGAQVLGWLVVVITCILLVVGLLGLWRIFLRHERDGRGSATLAVGS